MRSFFNASFELIQNIKGPVKAGATVFGVGIASSGAFGRFYCCDPIERLGRVKFEDDYTYGHFRKEMRLAFNGHHRSVVLESGGRDSYKPRLTTQEIEIAYDKLFKHK